jgi:dipeptidyl aminopeptidase/acylaminoacyl peptidase
MPVAAIAETHPFNVHDLVMMDRVSDPQISPDGKRVAYQLRETDYAENKGVTSVWIVDLAGKHAEPVNVSKQAGLVPATSPRWSPDGKSVFVLGKLKDETTQVWRLSFDKDAKGGSTYVTRRVTSLPLDVDNFKVSPDGKQILMSLAVFSDCSGLACTKKRLDEKSGSKASGQLFDKLFIRHWDTWANGTRSQLFIADVPADGGVSTEPRLLTKDIDGDVPSKPFGDDGEYVFSPDGKTVYFDVRIAGKSEPWSTNFDIYSVPADGSAPPKNLTAANLAWDSAPLPSADGKTLYYHAMNRPAKPTASASWRSTWPAENRTRSIRSGIVRPVRCNCRRTARRCTRAPTTTAITRCSPSISAAARRHDSARRGRSKASAFAATTSCSRAAR